MKTFSAKPEETERPWVLVDAKGQNLGRLASQIASILRGKHRPTFTPHIDTGDFVVVINAESIEVTGKKLLQKIYHHHTGYPGGIKTVSLRDLLAQSPEKVIEKAVWGMIPHNRLGRRQIRKLYVYKGEQHPHQAQKPTPVTLIDNKKASSEV